jgi:hypothetical protein
MEALEGPCWRGTERAPPEGPDGLTLYDVDAANELSQFLTSRRAKVRPEQQLDSQLPAADVVLDPATLDRVDQIVSPGVNLNPADTSYGEQVLQLALRRR